jgi:Skp family chaperone for outer membrane proteins
MGKYATELIIEAENDDKVLDTVNKPYTILYDGNVDRLNKAINILAVKRGYRVVNVSNSIAYWTACLEKMESK